MKDDTIARPVIVIQRKAGKHKEAYLLQKKVDGKRGYIATMRESKRADYLEVITQLKGLINSGEISSKKAAKQWLGQA
eukprot:15470129-Alexandrium_andersonii.AAC.1